MSIEKAKSSTEPPRPPTLLWTWRHANPELWTGCGWVPEELQLFFNAPGVEIFRYDLVGQVESRVPVVVSVERFGDFLTHGQWRGECREETPSRWLFDDVLHHLVFAVHQGPSPRSAYDYLQLHRTARAVDVHETARRSCRVRL